MDRKDFLKTIVLMIGGITIFRWLKPFESVKNLKEARFYGPANHLAG